MKYLLLAARSLALSLLISVSSGQLQAEVRPDRIHTADGKKTQAYLRDGVFVGGDKAINEVTVKDVRRAANPGFERIVVDLEGNRNGEAAAIPRPPFYQASVNSDEKRIVVTIFGKPKLAFDAKRILAAFKKSHVVDSVQFFPVLEDNSWTFVFGLKAESPVEVFELTNPVRIILDVKAPRPKPSRVVSRGRAAPAPVPVPTEDSVAPAIESESSDGGSGGGTGLDPAPVPKEEGHQ